MGVGSRGSGGVKIRNQRDFWSGVMFVAFGLSFAIGAQNYAFGTVQRMGPAFLPTLLGALLVLMGLFVAMKGLATQGRDAIGRFHWRPLTLVLGGVLLFAFSLRPLGLVFSLVILIFAGALGGQTFKTKEVTVVAAGVVMLVLVVFVWALRLPVPVWPAFVAG